MQKKGKGSFAMIDVFGFLPDGREVHRITISSGQLSARFLTWGAVLQEIRMDGLANSLTLGLSSLDEYLMHSKYFGATAGRCANRIGNGEFVLDGKTFRVDKNFLDRHQLHGGADGCGKRLWSVADHGPNYVTLKQVMPDGHMGYPGNLEIEALFRVENGALDVRYRATTDAPTLCNLAHHSYWILDGSGSVLDHQLFVAGKTYTPVDDDLIPTGETRPVDGTHLDFSIARPIREGSLEGQIDHNYAIAIERNPIDLDVARLTSLNSGLQMTIKSTEPGLQVYDAGPMDVPIPDIDGRKLGAHCGIALEPQIWPDAINHASFPSPILRPGEIYDQHTRFEFEKVT